MHTTIDPAAWRQALTAYTQFSDFLLRAVDGVSLGLTHADRLSRVAWLLAVEDASALGLLIENRLLGSARSLIRPQFESLVRGAWALQCTDEPGLQAIVDNAADFPMLGKAVVALMDAPAPFTLLEAPVPFHELDRRSRDAMNDHTHRGMRALARRTHALGLDSGSINDDEFSMFHLGTSVGGIAAAALLERSGRSGEARVVIGRLQLTTALWEPLPTDPPANASD